MRTIIWGKTFIRALKRTLKKHPNLKQELESTLIILSENPFDPKLETHKLKGKLAGAWACKAGYDLRIIFDFIKGEDEEGKILLIGIGTHDEVY